MPSSISRRNFLGHGLGFGSLLLAACGRNPAAAARDALVPTPHLDDGDAHGVFPSKLPVTTKPECTVTSDNIEGPFYKRGAPARAVLVGDGDRGERLLLSGTVRTTECTPLANAVLDIWQADARGGYDNDGWGLRGTLATDAFGRWELHTIIPGRYLNGPQYRPSHIHVKVSAPGFRPLTTQLYFDGDPYNDVDSFIHKSLIMKLRGSGAAKAADFDFVV